MKTKLLAAVLAVLSAATLSALEKVQIDNLYYNLDSSTGTAEVTYETMSSPNYSSLSGAIEIPSSIICNNVQYVVSCVGDSAFYYCTGLTAITIPENVTRIGVDAFWGCRSLTSIALPSSLTSIGNFAFSHTGLTAITIPESVTTIDRYAFQNCSNLKSVTLPETITSINAYTFDGCSSLTSINIPNGVTNMGSGAFRNCSSLTSITIPDSLKSIYKKTLEGCSNLSQLEWNAYHYIDYIGDSDDYDYTESPFYSIRNQISNFIVGSGVSRIPNHVLGYMSNLTSVTWNACNYSAISSSGTSPFYSIRKQITDFTFGSEVDTIPSYLCYEMSNLSSITIPEGVTAIGESAFLGCSSLSSIALPNSVTSIGSGAFSKCTKLSSITIPKGVTYLGIAFYGCESLTSVTWNACNYPVISSTFKSPFNSICDQITDFTFGSEVNTIPSYLCYEMSSLSSITIPMGVTAIGESAFSGCSNLSSISFPSSVTSIGNSAFSNCSSLSSIALPNSVMSIGFETFLDCSSLSSIVLPNSVTSIGSGAFYGCSSLSSIVLPNSVTSIGGFAFCRCSSLSSIALPSSVTSIGVFAFSGCRSLTSIALPSSVTSIGKAAFDGTGLTAITIPEGVTAIGENAFTGCSSLTSVTWNACNYPAISSYIESPFYSICNQITDFTFGSEVDAIPSYLCYEMSNLSSITLPNSVTTIENGAFGGCTGLTSITIPESITAIEANTFNQCTALSTISLPEGLISIAERAFYACPLTSVVLPTSLTLVGENAFAGNERLTEVTLGTRVTSDRSYVSVADNAFSGQNVTKVRSLYAIPPRLQEKSFGDMYAFLVDAEVPCEYLSNYKAAAYWRDFGNMECFGDATPVPVPDNDVTVNPGTDNAEFVWPSLGETITYELTIYKGGTPFCSLQFDAFGRLKGIRFAPAKMCQEQNAGFSFTVTGLDEATAYTYALVAKDADDNVVESYEGTFATVSDVGTGLGSNPVPLQVVNGTLQLNAPMQLSVYSAMGTLLYAGCTSCVTLPQTGVYFVQIGDVVQKLIVP